MAFLFFMPVLALNGQDFNKMVDELLSGSIPVIQPEALKTLSDNQSKIVILDTRERNEFNVSHLRNAKWVGYDDFELSRLTFDKKSEIIVYCSVGYRSEKIGEKLKDAGYLNVKNLYGGIFNWNNKGYKLVDLQNKETQKIHAYNESWGKWLTRGQKVYE